MPLYLIQVAQGPDDGGGWWNLLYLAVFMVLPLINAIKDKYVERTKAKDEKLGGSQKPRTPRVPQLRPVEPKLPTAKPLTMGDGVHRHARPPRPSSTPERAHVPGPPPVVGRAGVARRVPQQSVTPPVEAPPTPVDSPPSTDVPPVKGPPEARPPSAPGRETVGPIRQPGRTVKPAQARVPAARRKSVAGVDVRTAASGVGVHAADPTVQVRRAGPAADVAAGDPKVDVRGVTMAEAAKTIPSEGDLLGERLSPALMRRAVVLSEILQPPIALRDPGGLR